MTCPDFKHIFSGIKLIITPLILSIVLISCSDDEDINPGIKAEILDHINRLRTDGCRCGSEDMSPVPTVTWNTYLEAAAISHVNDMYDRDYLDHISPEGGSPAQRAMEAGYEGLDVGENIARGYQTTTDVIKAWQDSEAHCKAMMSGLYSEIGAARQESYWVLVLGNPD